MANNVNKTITISPDQEKFLEENPDVNLSSLARSELDRLIEERGGN